MNPKTILIDRRRLLLDQINALERHLETLPPGKIIFNKNGEAWRWRYVDSSQNIVSISKKDTSFASKMSEKRFLTDLLAALNTQVNAIDKCLEIWQDPPTFPNRLDEDCPDYFRLLAPFFSERILEQRRWANAPYEACPDHPERLIVPTKAGVMVRSKSESFIANSLNDHTLVFHYEEALQLLGIKIYPDFKIWNPGSGPKFIIWEHFGMMDVPAYALAARQKLAALLEAGFLPGWNLIITFEDKDHPLDPNYVEALISYHFHTDDVLQILKL
ncbi:MAG: hypothetical protein J5865_08190 [Lachnospiraceae bacterium]|nr:hypothetical protein [Lachnospiraceae bacterium]